MHLFCPVGVENVSQSPSSGGSTPKSKESSPAQESAPAVRTPSTPLSSKIAPPTETPKMTHAPSKVAASPAVTKTETESSGLSKVYL